MSTVLTGKPQLNRFVNRRLILEQIRRNGETSRADLAKQTAIRPPTVSAVVKELIDEGLIEERGIGQTSGGRAPRVIVLRRNRPRTLGFEISETRILAGLCDLAGNVCDQLELASETVPPETAVERMHTIGSKLLAAAGMKWDNLNGVGVAVQGHVNGAEGIVRWSHRFNWRNVPLKQMCERRWNIETDVINDCLAGGLAAHFFDVESEVQNLVFVYLRFRGTSHGLVGLGSGIIVNGEPYYGEFGAAGEITTMVNHPLVYAQQMGGRSYPGLNEFSTALEEDDPAASAALYRVGNELSVLALHIVNLLEPGVLMIGSDAPILRDRLLVQLQQVLDKQGLAYEAGKTRLLASTLGDSCLMRGAVVPTLQRVFRIPQW
ncbi:MAG: ROK family transcriptional regulator [Pirellulales bacterium]